MASADDNGRVVDTEGNTFLMSTVKAVPSSTAFVPVPDFAMGGSRKVEDRRREALREWLPMLLDRIRQAGERGLSVQQASKDTAAVPGFQQALNDQRATVLQFAQLWPTEIRIEKRGTQNILYPVLLPAAAAAAPRRKSQTQQQQQQRLARRALLGPPELSWASLGPLWGSLCPPLASLGPALGPWALVPWALGPGPRGRKNQ